MCAGTVPLGDLYTAILLTILTFMGSRCLGGDPRSWYGGPLACSLMNGGLPIECMHIMVKYPNRREWI